MKRNFYKFTFASLLVLFFLTGLNAQNQVYWREGFEPSTEGGIPVCDLTTTSPAVAVSYFFNANAGSWYGNNVYRTTGTGCPAGNNHVRYKNISGVTDSGYLITPTVNFGIKELHFLRARASRSYTIWMTSDTSALTTNWTMVTLATSSAATVVCVDTTILINSATAKRLKIVGRPGTDTDVDSIYITSVNAITPVKFGGVSASLSNGLAKISWDVISEINTANYYIEKSDDGKNFAAVGSLAATNASKYNFVDNAPASSIGYYRIKAVDKDGTIGYSNTVKLSSKKMDAAIAITPNPVVNGLLNLQMNNFSKSAYTISLYDFTGKQVFVKSFNVENGTSSQAIELPGSVTKGIYQLQVTNGAIKLNKSVVIQ